MALRGAIVGINFLVMMGLAAGLGLDTFGRLVFLWGMALVAGTVLSLGGPLILLRGLTDGRGMRVRDVLIVTFILPAAVAVVGYGAMVLLWPGVPWFAVLLAGLAVNALSCLASVMRAVGSVQLSMAARDMGPPVALGVGALSAQADHAGAVLIMASGAMVIIGAAALLWCRRLGAKLPCFSCLARRRLDVSLWGTSVLGVAVTQMDLVIGGMFLSPEALGTYAVLRRVANLVALPVTVATWVSAPKVSAAFGTGHTQALQYASVVGSRIALWPGIILFAFGLTAMPFVHVMLPDTATAFVILLFGALIQVFFASGYTVATLCDHAHLAALSRLVALISYLICVQVFGAQLGATVNAITYTAAMSASSVLLWAMLRQKIGVETSAVALWQTKGRAWRTS